MAGGRTKNTIYQDRAPKTVCDCESPQRYEDEEGEPCCFRCGRTIKATGKASS